MINLKIALRKNAKGEKALIPQRATEYSAGYDLHAFIEAPLEMKPKQIEKVPTGIFIELPIESVGLIYGRSGLGANHGITLPNCVGVVDSDYRGEIFVALVNNSNKTYIINPNDRIAQLVITPIIKTALIETDSLSDTVRGSSGFGSSGN